MSSILKALKKLENEKAGRAPDSLKIDSDILRTDDISQRFSTVTMVLVLLLVFLGGGTATYFFLKDPKGPPALPELQPVMKAKSLLHVVSSPPVKSETLPAEIVVVPASKASDRKTSNKEQKKSAVSNNKHKESTKKSPTKTISGISEKSKSENSQIIKALPEAAAVPNLRVNGIAFQTSSSDSMAIINGVSVSNGSTIEGVTIERILKDRVLFQKNGEKFEILLGQSN
jgi:general secretion pathway protein B